MMKPIFALLFVLCVAAVQARSTHWGSSNEENTYQSYPYGFRARETAISAETNKLVQSLNERDSSESNSSEQLNTSAQNIFQQYGTLGNWWQQSSVQPMLIKISERVVRTPTLNQEETKKDIVKQTENSFKYCKMGEQYDRGCLGARMGAIQKYITNLEGATRHEQE